MCVEANKSVRMTRNQKNSALYLIDYHTFLINMLLDLYKRITPDYSRVRLRDFIENGRMPDFQKF